MDSALQANGADKQNAYAMNRWMFVDDLDVDNCIEEGSSAAGLSLQATWTLTAKVILYTGCACFERRGISASCRCRVRDALVHGNHNMIHMQPSSDKHNVVVTAVHAMHTPFPCLAYYSAILN